MRSAFDSWCLDPEKYPIPSNLRKHCRMSSEFFPLSALWSRKLLLHILSVDKTHNIWCAWHHIHDKSVRINDSMGGKYQARKKMQGKPDPGPPILLYDCTGTHLERRSNIKQADGKYSNEAVEYYLNCGCPESESLLDMFLWKKGKIYSPTIDYEEGWRFQRLDPRQRALVCRQWEEATALVVDDLFLADDEGKKRPNHTVRFLEIQIQRLQERKARHEEEEVKRQEVAKQKEEALAQARALIKQSEADSKAKGKGEDVKGKKAKRKKSKADGAAEGKTKTKKVKKDEGIEEKGKRKADGAKGKKAEGMKGKDDVGSVGGEEAKGKKAKAKKAKNEAGVEDKAKEVNGEASTSGGGAKDKGKEVQGKVGASGGGAEDKGKSKDPKGAEPAVGKPDETSA